MINSLDLFCGAGGFSIGLEKTKKIQTKIALDFNKDATETFKHNFPNANVICGDITNEKIKSKIVDLAIKNNIQLVVGGPPCQGFSLKGKKLGMDDPRNFLFMEYFDIVSRIKPKMFVIENVKGLLHACDGYFIEQIKERFSNIGYSLSYDILNAYEYGTPQKRERTIIFGLLGNIKPIFPMKTLERYTVHDAISDLAYLESGEGDLVQKYRVMPLTKYQEDIRCGSDKLTFHQATSHSKDAIYKLSLIPPECGKEYLPKEMWGKQKFKTTWGRLEWDKPSGTIDTRFDTPSNGKNSHPFLNRSITPREAARIQGFPDTFYFIGKKSSICKQIGNAVPIPLGYAIGLAIINNIEKDCTYAK